MNIRIGLLDTGITGQETSASASFLSEPQTAMPVAGHDQGSQLAAVIKTHTAASELLDARSLLSDQEIDPAAVAAGIEWLVEQRADVINLSFELPQRDAAVEIALDKALSAGALCVAAVAAADKLAFPANHPGVVAVSADARCSAGEYSQLETSPSWLFGAASGGPEHRAHQRGLGANYACAHVSGALAQLLHSGVSKEQLLSRFADHCYWDDSASAAQLQRQG